VIIAFVVADAAGSMLSPLECRQQLGIAGDRRRLRHAVPSLVLLLLDS